MEFAADIPQILMYLQEIPMTIAGIVQHIATIASNPVSLIKEAYLNFDGVKVLIKTGIRAPIRNLQCLFKRSLSPLASQGVEILMVGYDHLIYRDIILQILYVLECLIHVVEILDKQQMISPELVNFYNSIGNVLGIATTYNILMRCAYINSIKGVKEVADIFVRLLTSVYTSIEDIFKQLGNIVNWISNSMSGNQYAMLTITEIPQTVIR